MTEVKCWFQNLSWENAWNNSEKELRFVLRVFTVATTVTIIYWIGALYMARALVVSYTSDGGVPIPTFISQSYFPFFQCCLTLILSITTVAAAVSRSYFGWLGLIAFASQMVLGPLVFVGIPALYWLSRDSFRGLFRNGNGFTHVLPQNQDKGTT